MRGVDGRGGVRTLGAEMREGRGKREERGRSGNAKRE